MIVDGVPGQVEPSSTLGGEELHRLLIEQFHEDSVGRYGPASEQAHALWRLLVGD
jgi:hypothetical protein